MANKNKEHWGNLISSLEEEPNLLYEEETKTESSQPKEAPAVEGGSQDEPETASADSKVSRAKSEKPSKTKSSAKKRVPRPASERGGAAKKEKDLTIEKSLLDSLDSIDGRVDLTVGADAKKEKKSRRAQKSEKAAAEEKKARTKQKKIADAIVEKAEEPFREIASQIEGRIAELTEEETGKKPAKKSRKAASRKQAAEPVLEKPLPPAEPAEAVPAESDSDDFSWDFEETLEVSWGHVPTPLSASAAESAEPESAGSSVSEAASLEEPQKKENAAADDREEKLSLEEAQKKFSSIFAEPEAASPQNEASSPKPAASVEDNDFWGIPDEPELEFATTKPKSVPAFTPEPKPEPKTERKAEPKPARDRAPSSALPKGAKRPERTPSASETRRESPRRETSPAPESLSDRRPQSRREHRFAEQRGEFSQPRGGGQRNRRDRDFTPRRNEDELLPFSDAAEDFRHTKPNPPQRENEYFDQYADDDSSRTERGTGRRREKEFSEERESAVSPRRERELPERPARTVPREGERVFPTWQDAIGEVVRGNINRHGNSSKGGGGDRQRR